MDTIIDITLDGSNVHVAADTGQSTVIRCESWRSAGQIMRSLIDRCAAVHGAQIEELDFNVARITLPSEE